MAARHINEQQLRELIASGKTVLVDFWAPWCSYCKRINPAYEQIAEEYGDVIEVVKVDMDENEPMWDTDGIELIPTIRIYKDGKDMGSIVAPESKAMIEEFISSVIAVKKRGVDEHVYDMVIVGGGPGGYTVALYAARAGLDVVVLERLSAGGQMALTKQIDNYPGFEEGIGGYELAVQMQKQAEKFGAKTVNTEVSSLELGGDIKEIITSDGRYFTRTVAISTGANPRELGLPDEQALIGKGVAYCAACDGFFYKGKTVVVVGGGNSAAADALLLSKIAEKVIVVHRRDTLRATKVYHAPLMQAENVEFMWNSVVEEILHDDMVTGVRLRDVNTGEVRDIATDGVFVSIGRKPATGIVEGKLELDAGGYIVAGETTETSVPGVYAVGDVRTKLLRQVVTAVSDGAVAVHMAEEYLASLK